MNLHVVIIYFTLLFFIITHLHIRFGLKHFDFLWLFVIVVPTFSSVFGVLRNMSSKLCVFYSCNGQQPSQTLDTKLHIATE